MKKIDNFESVQASTGEFLKPSAGGYICKIVNVEDVPFDAVKNKGDYLKIEYDIDEGDFECYYKDQFDRWGGFWGASFIRSYKDKALGMFKHFTNCVEASNARYMWDWNETSLIGKRIGLVLGEEEYINNAGEVKSKLVVKEIKTVDDIKAGNFKVPALKKVSTNSVGTAPAFSRYMGTSNNFEEIKADDDLPF